MTERSLDAWLAQLESLHPREIDLGRERIRRVARNLGLLPVPVPVVTVAGTNGKGSTVATVDALLREAGLSVGLYTSPHLLRYNERIVIDGAPADDAAIVGAFERIEAARGATSLTYFEFATLAALLLFAEARVDRVVLEVGLGGRLDATNIVDADVTAITSIDLDHQEWLGPTREAIAREKAGIARRDQPVVLAERDYPVTLAQTLDELGARPLCAGDAWDWSCEDGELTVTLADDAGVVSLPMPTGLVPSNLAAGIQLAASLGLGSRMSSLVPALAGLQVPGRLQSLVVDGIPWILDVAHNPASAQYLLRHLREHPVSGDTLAVVGLMADKDAQGMFAGLAGVVAGAWAVALPGNRRAATARALAAGLRAAGLSAVVEMPDPAAAVAAVRARAQPGDRVVAFGSFFTVGGIMQALKDEGIRLPQ